MLIPTYPNPLRLSVLAILSALSCAVADARAEPLAIDLTVPVPAATASPYGPGATRNPHGDTITADNRSFFLNGTPWIPVAGEFHYARYPKPEWRDALLKMKAGGINTVSTYVFWIYHEEERGVFDWSGQRSLRDFIQLAQDVGLKVIVRMGPWCHGEVRNGGFPDWVQHSGAKLRTSDPEFMKLVEPFFKEEAGQMAGLLFKDGGPVIGVQMDNECNTPDYLLALKKMARAAGVDVPFYTMTGWNGVRVPAEGLIPVFGAYSQGFWGGSPEDYRKFYVFSPIRDNGDMGAQFQNIRSSRNQTFEHFPFACAEIGAGMMSSYGRRIKIQSADIGAMALVKLGCGSNLPGYYMYQGGTNPDGKLSWLNEEHPSQLPFKDYDFQTALSACGQVRPQYHLLREQHLFLEDFGPILARMPTYFPAQRPADLKDFDTLRWSVRSDGQSGFLFFNNQQPHVPLPDHPGVQFALKTSAVAPLLVPREPLSIPSGAYGVWPVNLDCDGVTLTYATAQPLCRVQDDRDNPVYFFAALAGVRTELLIDGKLIPVPAPGLSPVATVKNPQGRPVTFVVLSPSQAVQLYRAPFAGRDRVILSAATVLAAPGALRLQTDSAQNFTFAIFPPLKSVLGAGKKLTGSPDGIFSRFTPATASAPYTPVIRVTLQKPAGPAAATLKGMNEATWADAAIYTLAIPPDADGHRLILDLHYTGDAARLYVGDKLFNDHFYNGDPLAIALWRIPVADWTKLTLKILPASDALLGRLPASAKRIIIDAKAAGTLDTVTATTSELLELPIRPLAP